MFVSIRLVDLIVEIEIATCMIVVVRRIVAELFPSWTKR